MGIERHRCLRALVGCCVLIGVTLGTAFGCGSGDTKRATSSCTLDGGGVGSTCGGTCVDTQTDPMNCGDCDAPCDTGSICTSGKCANVVGALDGLRWDLPCIAPVPGETTCTVDNSTPQMATVQGTPGTTYDVTLRFRGVVEQETYNNTTPGITATGTNASFFSVGGTSGGDGWNVYTLSIQGPEQGATPLVAHLNSGASGLTTCWPIDYTVTLPIEASSTVSLTTDAVDGRERSNQGSDGNPIVVSGVSPAPDAYDGQFVQMDVVSVVAAQ